MARSCGIRIGPRRFEIVELEGSPKKPKVKTAVSGEFPVDADDPIGAASAVIKAKVKEHKVSGENVGLVIDSGLAAFRTLKLPFDDKNKIEEVIKFEVESQLPQWDIDDVVVDSLTLSSTGVESQLLAIGVPKDDLQTRIEIATAADLEPQDAELEVTAVVNVAHAAGLCTVDGAQLFLHVGETTTTVVLMDGGQLRSTRAIHTGSLLTDAVTVLDSEVGAEAGAEEPPDGAEQSVEPTPHAPSTTSSSLDPKRSAEVLSRIRREIVRTITGANTVNEIESIYVCGLDLPGAVGESVEGVTVERLKPTDDPMAFEGQDGSTFVAAYGAALGRLGGGVFAPTLRREELRYQGKFERLELPLAVLGLLVWTLLAVRFIKADQELGVHKADVATWVQASNNYMLGNPMEGVLGSLESPPPLIQSYAQTAGDRATEVDTDGRDRFQMLAKINTMLQKEIGGLRAEVGEGGAVAQPQSALQAMTLVLGVLESGGDEFGRWALRNLEATYQPGRQNRSDQVQLKLDMTFWGKPDSRSPDLEATENYQDFVDALNAEPWLVNFESKSTEVLDTGDGISINGIPITVDTSAVEEVQL